MRSRARSRRPRGGIALVALVCLSVIALIVAGLLRVGASRAEQIRALERRAQASWLVEAGLERSVSRLRIDPSYAGETWAVPADAIGGRAASVLIEVDRSHPGGEAGPTLDVRIRADYPSDGDPSGRARRSKVFQVRPPAEREGTDS